MKLSSYQFHQTNSKKEQWYLLVFTQHRSAFHFVFLFPTLVWYPEAISFNVMQINTTRLTSIVWLTIQVGWTNNTGSLRGSTNFTDLE